MVDLRINFKTRAKLENRLRKALEEEGGRILRNNFSDFRPIVEKAINDAVDDNSLLFVPNQDEAAELGIGENGSIDFQKISFAWRQLRTDSPENIMNFFVRKTGTSRSRKIGEIFVEFDVQDFFDAPLSRVDTPDSDILDFIPWMEWFLEGQTIFGHRFSDKQPIPGVSRTGRGIMIKGGAWFFRPRRTRQQVFEKLRRAIESSIINSVNKNIGDVL